MQEFCIGEIIQKRRSALGLTQEQVCEGICEPSTLSRIESGRQTPSRNKVMVILQRLGLSGERYFALVNKKDLEIQNIPSEIVSCEILGKSSDGLTKLKELEQMITEDDVLIQQFVLSARATFGKTEGNKIKPYPFETKLDLLFTALHMTVPNFDVEEIGKCLYGIDEVKIINKIALAYSDAGRRKDSIDIFYQLFKYVKKHFQELHQSAPIVILISYNYSRDLCLEKRFKEAIDIANLGLHYSIKMGRSVCLGGLLYVLADSFYHLGQEEKSKEYFRQAFYIYTVMQDNKNVALVQATVKEFWNIKIDH